MASKYLETYGRAAFELGPQSVIRYTSKGETRDLEKPNSVNRVSVMQEELSHNLPYLDRHFALVPAVKTISDYLSHLALIQSPIEIRPT